MNGDVDPTKNAGNIAKQTITVGGMANPFVQKYEYDPLDRITEARETVNGSQTWIQQFGYDRYGNRTSLAETVQGQFKPISEVTLPSVDANTNRFSSGTDYEYDAVGNLIRDAHGRQFTFNGDNKQTLVKDQYDNTVGEYLYDGSGKRVKKVTASEYVIFVYDAAGKLIAELSTDPPSNPTVNYTATDPLGSPRVITNKQGEVISRRDFMPFGEEIMADATYRTAAYKYGVGDGVRQKFTGYERDEETGLDFAEARYYYNNHGRFTAVDPLLASGKSANPQTFNRYVYTMNRPLILTDPKGLQAGSGTGGWEIFKTSAFALTNPIVAATIGLPNRLGTNISSTAARFAANSAFQDNNRSGGERNALRHGIWSALISRDFGAETAKAATDAHEPSGSIEMPSDRTFEDPNMADTAVDLENNALGIQIGTAAAERNLSNKETAVEVLNHFKEKGLWVTRINEDGSETMVKTKIGKEEYERTLLDWNTRDDQGLTENGRQEVREKEQERVDAYQFKVQ